MNEKTRARKKNKTEHARERKRDREEEEEQTREQAKTTFNIKGQGKCSEKGKNKVQMRREERNKGLWRRGNEEEDWGGSCGNAGGPRPASSGEGMSS